MHPSCSFTSKAADRFRKAAATHPYTPKHGTSADGKTQAQQERSPFVYVWFGGAPEEDVQSFVYSVQRTASSQNRQTDDAWIVRYVETCLSGDALLWFSALEGETKRSWTRLSEALLHNFAPPPQTKGRCENPSSPANPFDLLLLSPKPGKAGAVQVIDATDQGFLGYLCKNLTFAVDPHASDALLVECPASGPGVSLEEPTYLRIANQDPQSAPAFLGLTGGGTEEVPKPWLLTPCSSASFRSASSVVPTMLPLSSSTLVWKTMSDGELSLAWPKDDGRYIPLVIGRDPSATASIVLDNPNPVIDRALFKDRCMDVLIAVTESQLASTLPGFRRVVS
ncbi:hypothetical protein FRC04_001309 [Tulasnella sp. 424]|nr:hypothetical protein FRC04_001309 [Tulasnella sp. 424]